MISYEKLLLENKAWAESVNKNDPQYLPNVAKAEHPEFLWIGCADSRVPPSELTGTHLGEILIHRNIANMVVHTDFNLLGVLQYAVQTLKVNHVILCGHFGCDGVKAALTSSDLGLLNKWLRNIKDVYRLHADELDPLSDDPEALQAKLVELNVREQVRNLARTSIVQKAWKERQGPVLHGWVYDMKTGLIDDLEKVDHTLELNPIDRFD